MTPKEVLELFDEKYARLQSSSLIRFMANPGWKLAFDFTTNTPSIDSVLPDLELVESYVLNLRFFIQDKDPISLRNLSKFYETNCPDQEIKKKFVELHRIFNSELDKEWPFLYNDQKLTFRDIFDGFIYSKIAHRNVNRHKIFHNLTKHPFGYFLALDYFLRCINFVHEILTMIGNLNKVAFANLKEN